MKKRLLLITLSVLLFITFLPSFIHAEGNEAKINKTEYATLAEALSAANSDNANVTITLLQNVTTDSQLLINGNPNTISLVLNNFTLTSNYSGSDGAIYIKSGASFCVENGEGTIIANNSTLFRNRGTLDVSGGFFAANNGNAIFDLGSNAISNIKNGGYYNQNISSALSGSIYKCIEKTTYPDFGYYVRIQDSKTITFDGNGATSGSLNNVKVYENFKFTAPDCGDLSRSGWYFAGWNTQADGKGTYVHVGKVFLYGQLNFDTLYAQWLPMSDAVCTINGVGYKTLADAVTDFKLNDNLTLTLLKDSYDTRVVSYRENAVLDLNGYILSYDGNKPTVEVYSYDLQIKGNGQVISKTNDAVYVNQGSECRIENGSFKGARTAVYVRGGALWVNGGNFVDGSLASIYDHMYEDDFNASTRIYYYGGYFESYPDKYFADDYGDNHLNRMLFTRNLDYDSSISDITDTKHYQYHYLSGDATVMTIDDNGDVLYAYPSLAAAVKTWEEGEILELNDSDCSETMTLKPGMKFIVPSYTTFNNFEYPNDYILVDRQLEKGTEYSLVKCIAYIDDEPYATLKEAVDAAIEGDYIDLRVDTSEDITVSKNIVLKLNSHTLEGSVVNNSNLSIIGPGNIVSKSDAVINNGDLLIDGAKVKAVKKAVVMNNSNSSLNLDNACELVSTADIALYVGNVNEKGNTNQNSNVSISNTSETAAVKISGDKFGIYLGSYNGIYGISDCNVSGQSGIYLNQGALTIFGGTVKATGENKVYQCEESTGDAIIVDNSQYKEPELMINSTTLSLNSANNRQIGVYYYSNLKTAISSKVCSTNIKYSLTPGYTWVNDMAVKATGSVCLSQNNVDVYYDTLKDALDNSDDNKAVLTLMADISISDDVEIAEGKDVLLDLSYFNIRGEGQRLLKVAQDAKLTIQGQGKITNMADEDYACVIDNEGELVIDGAGLMIGGMVNQGLESSPIDVCLIDNDGDLTINGGSFVFDNSYSSNLNTKELFDGSGSVNIYGGTFELKPSVSHLADNRMIDKVGNEYVVKQLFNNVSVSIDDSLNLNYKMNIPYPYDLSVNNDFHVRFTLNGDTVIKDYEVVGDQLLFTFDEMTPKFMSDKVLAEFLIGEELAGKKTYSLREYCDMAYSYDYASKLGYNIGQVNIIKQLLTDLLSYGAACQVYDNYQTNKLVNDGFKGYPRGFVPNGYTDMSLSDTKDDDINFSGVRLLLDDNIHLKFIFKMPDEDADNVKVTIKAGDKLKTCKASNIKTEGDSYYVISDGVKFCQCGLLLEVTLYNNDVEVQTLKYSVNSYAFANRLKDTNNANLAKRLYCLGESVREYREFFNK